MRAPTRWRSRRRQKYPDRFCILGWFPLDKPEERKRIETWKQRPGMLGLRWSLTRPEQENWHKDGTMDWVWPAAERAGTPIATMAWRFLPLFKRDRGEASQSEAAHRSSRTGALGEGRRGVRRSGHAVLAGEAAERRGQGDRRAGLFAMRRIRSATSMTGCTASSTPTGRSASSGAPTSRACRAATGNA